MKIILFANTSWFLYNFHLQLARTLRDQGHEVILLSPTDEYGVRLESEGFRHLDIPLSRRGINPLSELASLIRIYQIYRLERPDLVHHFTIKCVLYGTLAARLAGVKRIVNWITGLGYIFIGKGILPRTLKTLAFFAYRALLSESAVIFENQDDQIFFETAKLVKPGHHFLIIGTGVDTDQFNAVPESPGAPIVIMPSRLLWDKGVGEFIEASRMIKRAGIESRFALVGKIDPGNPSAVPEADLQAWVKEGLVEWWGWKEDMPSVYAQSHIVCLPSYREGVPKALLEAAAAGRPIVASDVPGCREVVREGVNGFLVPPRDPVALAKALERLLRDITLRGKMGANGRDIAVEQFSVQFIVEQILAVYRHVETMTG